MEGRARGTEESGPSVDQCEFQATHIVEQREGQKHGCTNMSGDLGEGTLSEPREAQDSWALGFVKTSATD